MVATVSMESQGVVLARGDAASPEVYTAIPQIVNWSGPGGAAATIIKTTLDSLAVEKQMGLPDEGDFTFELIYNADNAVHAGLKADRKLRTRRSFKMTLTDASPATVLDFAGFVTEFAISGAVDEIVRAAVTIVIDGEVTDS